MLDKFGIFIAILFLVFLFYIVISLGAGAFKKDGIKNETKRYIKSVNILLIFVAIVGSVLVLFLN
tara:strand:- start:667 stop:861 length:195 start_codon:yes stop_codon:yes gene_type:complete